MLIGIICSVLVRDIDVCWIGQLDLMNELGVLCVPGRGRIISVGTVYTVCTRINSSKWTLKGNASVNFY